MSSQFISWPSTRNGVATSVQGSTSGTNPAAGYIGEILISTVSTAANVGTTAQYFDTTSLSITAGIWEVSGAVSYLLNGATMSNSCEIGYSTTAGNSSAGLVETVNNFQSTANPNSSDDLTVVGLSYRVAIAATTTYYLKGFCQYSAGTPKYRCTLRAVRVA